MSLAEFFSERKVVKIYNQNKKQDFTKILF